jgi:cytochrome c oxidase cbb3-type subunit 3
MSEKKVDTETGIETTGHSWDGIEELNSPLPRWWLWTFYACIVWAVLYTIAYPAWPLVSKATPGLLGFSTRGQVAEDIARVEEANRPLNEKLEGIQLASLTEDPALHTYATNAGAAVFATYCSQCHGSGAAGAKGYPNLLDNDWLWGGAIDDIAYTVRHGIRNEVDADAHWSQMPAFGELLEPQEIAAVADHVRQISGQTPNDPALLEQGAVIFDEQCSACHGIDGEGDRALGAPTLSDAIWLYGGDYDTIVETVTYSRFGVMPPWSERLSEAEVRAVASYVHQLGGGEASAPQ